MCFLRKHFSANDLVGSDFNFTYIARDKIHGAIVGTIVSDKNVYKYVLVCTYIHVYVYIYQES